LGNVVDQVEYQAAEFLRVHWVIGFVEFIEFIVFVEFVKLIEFVGSFMRSGLAFRDDCPVL